MKCRQSILKRDQTLLIVIDIQERLFAHVDHACEFLDKVLVMVSGCQILGVPIVVSEQYPQGLGRTVGPLKKVLGEANIPHAKTAFSAVHDPKIQKLIKDHQRPQCILVGLEAHICILQTAKDLLDMEYEVTVVNDAISSRSLFDFSTAIAELRDCGARITSTETILFELLRDSKAKEFKSVSELIK